ncbi:unnamed protein product [Ectocarpus sp. CCAP 1310/34]|nr:unnamed protein product [Ectocarpus sp. CCAP 1310/34]
MMAQGFSSVFASAVCLLAATTSAFVVPSARVHTLAPRAAAATATSASALRTSARHSRRSALFMSEEAEEVAPAAEQDPAQDATASVKSFFAPNENVRLGSSRDQDGKSNVWAVEPKMRVEGTDVETPENNSLLIVGGIVGALVVAMSATIAFLPPPDSM